MTGHNPALTADTPVFDYDNPAVARFVNDAGCYQAPSIAKAVERLHDAVRDTIDYNVFNVSLHPDLRASGVVAEASGFCLHKSILFVAGCRKLGVPAMLCSDVVTNHVADAAMLELVGGEEFLHWYARIYLNGRWIKAAPIFNALLCALYNVDVLRFNPNGDSIEQSNGASTKMLYRGEQRSYPEPEMVELLQIIQDKHPKMVTDHGRTPTSMALSAAAMAR
ncbi:transglutaminase-like domain-containing protein [Arthrobacter silvisoli]|uniref:transglutaminase-like domain-containing protein n=1 Tax=Arthrobacter silvisoli TaxID=2291022 RepID=UPI000E219FFA|nr:transglutaminase family protein [Arthrobacter silvisoli]